MGIVLVSQQLYEVYNFATSNDCVCQTPHSPAHGHHNARNGTELRTKAKSTMSVFVLLPVAIKIESVHLVMVLLLLAAAVAIALQT